jgi:hypothetical protein
MTVSEIQFESYDEDLSGIEVCTIDFVALEYRSTFVREYPLSTSTLPETTTYSYFIKNGRMVLQWARTKRGDFENDDPVYEVIYKGYACSRIVEGIMKSLGISQLPLDKIGITKFYSLLREKMTTSDKEDFYEQVEDLEKAFPDSSMAGKKVEKIVIHAEAGRWESVIQLVQRYRKAEEDRRLKIT